MHKRQFFVVVPFVHLVLRDELSGYDRFARDPSFAKADSTVFSELLLLQNHYHPSVSLFASNIIKVNDLGLVFHFFLYD